MYAQTTQRRAQLEATILQLSQLRRFSLMLSLRIVGARTYTNAIQTLSYATTPHICDQLLQRQAVHVSEEH